jgi:mannose/cellobiose epimerase-like protein (N-acyl-D-glucosamine 2-epimerase family)
LIASAVRALCGLNLYLRPNGLWHDKLDADGMPQAEPAPASSLYHIMAAGRQLRESLPILKL